MAEALAFGTARLAAATSRDPGRVDSALHPSEVDKMSAMQLAAWEASGTGSQTWSFWGMGGCKFAFNKVLLDYNSSCFALHSQESFRDFKAYEPHCSCKLPFGSYNHLPLCCCVLQRLACSRVQAGLFFLVVGSPVPKSWGLCFGSAAEDRPIAEMLPFANAVKIFHVLHTLCSCFPWCSCPGCHVKTAPGQEKCLFRKCN